jgi:cation diffusion facilitator CzcD-associated flavoprotein CzcO
MVMAGWSHAMIHFEPEAMQMIKTIVIGAGVMGASVAYRLAQAGAAVTVLEATRIGGGTTGISGLRIEQPVHRCTCTGCYAAVAITERAVQAMRQAAKAIQGSSPSRLAGVA